VADRQGDRLALVRAVIEQTFVGPERGLAALGPFRRLLDRGRAWTLTVGDGDTAAVVAAMRDGALYKTTLSNKEFLLTVKSRRWQVAHERD
jgi:Na+/H+-dicarboxylate symporter